MTLLEFIIRLLINSLIGIFSLSCWLKFSKININKRTKILVIFASSLSITTASQFFPNPIKIVIIFITLIAINYFFINQKIKKSIISVTISQLILALSEFSFAIILSLFYSGDRQQFPHNALVNFLVHVYIRLISILI